MKFICVQPESNYFIWQVQVLLNNFKKHEIEKDAIIIFGYDKNTGINPRAVEVFKNSKASFHYLIDDRNILEKSYISSIRPHLLKKLFQANKIEDDLLYHDCDILFNRLPVLQSNTIQVSDCIGYLGAEYIRSKGEGLFNEMCDVVGIDPATVIENENNTGGAQYFIPKSIPMTFEFWNKVEKDSINLYRLMKNTSNKYNPSHPIQSWTADMWALIWNFWLAGYETQINKELEFSWATMPINLYNDYNIYHNAGATAERTELFFKADFIHRSPFGLDHENVSKEYCSYKYLQEIIETSLN